MEEQRRRREREGGRRKGNGKEADSRIKMDERRKRKGEEIRKRDR